MCESIAASASAQLKQNNTIILAEGFVSGETVELVTNSGVVMMPHLFSTQEETDTRLVLHVIDLATTLGSSSSLIIQTSWSVCSITMTMGFWLMKSTCVLVTRKRYIPIHKISGELCNGVSACLPAAHALIGCDTTSTFLKIENVPPSQSWQSKLFGGSSSLSISLGTARIYVLLLYGKGSKKCNTLNDLGYALASTNNKHAATNRGHLQAACHEGTVSGNDIA